ncbi:hypothetical protein PVNG_05346 [Plasmodium vivax North Korean]|uniref:Uncharacterized protein n=1 Tax=Plasmodium vivax North Korean TaxID=1035514 RepID=A0A0J9TY18_PLAVI|nr:hypothetical protein PVNG_05346 [Plasmodium vivax North Korean]
MSNHNKCNPKFETVNHQDWENRNKLYDYYIDYDTLSTVARFHDRVCKYYKTFEEKKSLYKHIEREYSSRGYICSQFFNNSKEYS